MDSQQLGEALTRAGLTDYQAEVYLAVLDLGSGPVVDVTDRTDVPASQVYEVVRSLEDQGFVESDGDLYTVGGWGAVFEDVEAEVVRVDRVKPGRRAAQRGSSPRFS